MSILDIPVADFLGLVFAIVFFAVVAALIAARVFEELVYFFGKLLVWLVAKVRRRPVASFWDEGGRS